jgi:hypothetical protein
MNAEIIKLGSLMVAAFFITGCIGKTPSPTVARNGGSVDLNLGGIKRNAGGQLITADDLTVTITDSLDVQHTPRILGLFRVFPDHTSQYAVEVQNRALGAVNALTPHDGALWLQLALCDPVDVSPNRLDMAAGAATISVTAPKLLQTYDTFGFSAEQEGDYSDIPIIIAAENYFSCRGPSVQLQKAAYQAVPFLTLKPDSPIPAGVTVGGAQIDIDFKCELTEGNGFQMSLVPQHSNPNVNLSQSAPLVSECTGTWGTLKAVLTNINGIVARDELATWTQGQGTEDDLHLALVASGGASAVLQSELDGPTPPYMVSGHYVDTNGDTIPNMTPMLVNEWPTLQ